MLGLREGEDLKHSLTELIERQLNPNDPVPLNIYEIRNYVYYGLSDRKMRPRYWKILFKYCPSSKFGAEKYYMDARTAYMKILKTIDHEDGKIKNLKLTLSSELDRSKRILEENCLKHIRPALERILLAFSVVNPALGYVQGMINIVTVIFSVMEEDEDLENRKFAEEDTFHMFNHLMSEMLDIYLSENDHQQSGLMSRIDQIFQIIQVKDPQLYEAIIEKDLDKAMFPVRWILLLFSSEYDLKDTVWLWDKIMADSYRFELVLYLSASIIILMRNIILDQSFERCLLLLQKPYLIKAGVLFELADFMRRENGNIENILKNKFGITQMSSKK